MFLHKDEKILIKIGVLLGRDVPSFFDSNFIPCKFMGENFMVTIFKDVYPSGNTPGSYYHVDYSILITDRWLSLYKITGIKQSKIYLIRLHYKSTL